MFDSIALLSITAHSDIPNKLCKYFASSVAILYANNFFFFYALLLLFVCFCCCGPTLQHETDDNKKFYYTQAHPFDLMAVECAAF